MKIPDAQDSTRESAASQEVNFLFTPIDSEMWEAGYPRYSVQIYATREFVGEVSQYRPPQAGNWFAPRWLAQRKDGEIRGLEETLSNRQAAAGALL